MNFKYTENTSCNIDNKPVSIRCENGMTGIGSRRFWINNKAQSDNLIIFSEDISNGNHSLYYGYWGSRPWDTCYFLVADKEKEDFIKAFNNNKNVYGVPTKLLVDENTNLRKE